MPNEQESLIIFNPREEAILDQAGHLRFSNQTSKSGANVNNNPTEMYLREALDLMQD